MLMQTPRGLGTEGAVYFYTARGARYPMHHHDSLEVNLCGAGRAAYLVGAQRVELEPGSLVWLPPRQRHLLIDISPDFVIWVLEYDEALLRRLRKTPGTRVLAGLTRTTQCSLRPEQRRHMERLFRELQQLRDPASFNALLTHTLTKAWSYQSGTAPVALEELHPAVERAVRLLVGGSPPQSLPQLARASGLSTQRLSRVFKAQVGISIAEFRNRQRLERFLELYGEGQHLSVTEAADRAGFGSYTQFHRVFRALRHEGPRDFVRRMRGERSEGHRPLE